jgi:hypothetical protein
MSSKEIDIQESTSSLSEVSSLNDDLDNMHLESGSSVEEMSDDEMDSNSWNEIESEPDEEFMEDHGLVDEVISASEDNTVHPIDCYRHFITMHWLLCEGKDSTVKRSELCSSKESENFLF